MTATYIISLSVIAVLAVLVHVMLDRVIAVQSSTGEVVNVSGQQRMLSQRASLFVLHHLSFEDVESRVLAENAVATMKRNHQFLIQAHLEALASDQPSPMSDRLRQMYFAAPLNVDAQIKRFEGLVTDALASVEAQGDSPQARENIERVLAISRTTLLSALDKVVQQYEAESLERVDGLRKAQLIVLGIIILTIVLEARFIFRPMVSRVRDFARRLQHDANHDYMTGLLNRRAFFMLADRAWALAGRNRRPISVLLVDIDHFKRVNDDYGHDVGDLVLTHAAHLIQRSFRKSDIVARFGGEEFVVLMPETDADAAKQVSEKLRELLNSAPIVVGEDSLTVKVSCGIAAADIGVSGAGDTEQLIALADKALYEAKNSGRDRSVIYSG